MRDLLQDARFASRQLRKNKTFTVIVRSKSTGSVDVFDCRAGVKRGGAYRLLHPDASRDTSRPNGGAAVRIRKVGQR